MPYFPDVMIILATRRVKGNARVHAKISLKLLNVSNSSSYQPKFCGIKKRMPSSPLYKKTSKPIDAPMEKKEPLSMGIPRAGLLSKSRFRSTTAIR